MKATVSGVFEDLKFEISEGSVAEAANRADSGQLQILNVRSSSTPETVAFTN